MRKALRGWHEMMKLVQDKTVFQAKFEIMVEDSEVLHNSRSDIS